MHARIMRNLKFYLKKLENDKIQVVSLYVRFARPQECEKYVTMIVKLMPYFGKFYIFRRKNIIILIGYNT